MRDRLATRSANVIKEDPRMNTPKEMATTIIEALGAALAGDAGPLTDCLHPDLVVHEPPYLPYGGEYTGPDDFLNLLAEATQFIDATSVEMLDVIADGDRVVLLMSARIIGHPEPVQITEHWVLKGDKVIDVRVFWYNPPFAS
jgi:hypothetical protein